MIVREKKSVMESYGVDVVLRFIALLPPTPPIALYGSLLPPITALAPGGTENRRPYATARCILKISDGSKRLQSGRVGRFARFVKAAANERVKQVLNQVGRAEYRAVAWLQVEALNNTGAGMTLDI